MKLRQKLAAALATAMVVTSVPVVTMASSNNKVVRATQVFEKDSQITTGTALKVKFEDATGDDEEFYITLENAEWLKDEDIQANKCDGFTYTTKNTWTTTLNGKNVTYTRQSDKTVRVQAESIDNNDQITFPIMMTAKGGTITATISAEGGETSITEGTYTIGTTGEKAGSVEMQGDVSTFYDNGELTKILVKESFVGSLTKKDLVLKVELNDTDFEFTSTKAKVLGTYGFSGIDFDAKVAYEVDDKAVAYIYIPKSIFDSLDQKSLGRLEITGLTVDNDEKDITVGNLTADIKAVKYNSIPSSVRTAFGLSNTELAEIDKDYTDLVVANIVNYGAYIEMKNEKAVDIVAGRDEEIEFKVAETVDDCFVAGRTIEITLDSDEYDESFFWINYDKDGDYKTALVGNADDRKIIDSIEVVWNDDANKDAYTGNDKFTYEDGQAYRADAIKVKLKNGDKSLNTNGDKDKFTVKTKVYVPVDQKDKKELKLVAEMRGVDDFKSATAVNVINPFDVTSEQTTLKVGLQKQTAGKITITETNKEMFNKGNIELNITASKEDFNGIVIDNKGKLTVSGDLKKADLEDAKGTTQTIELKRQSKSASSLTIEDMLLTVDRTVPEGTYDLEIGGTAIDAHGGTLKIKDFIKIGTANTQDIIGTNGLAAATAVFTIDSTTYLVNNVEHTMDAPAYIAGEGYTMIPMRYVANAFGITPENILFSNGTATFFAGTRTIQLTTGSDIAVVNGAQIKMATKVANKNGRLYVPVGEIANILGVSKSWDAPTKTATFSNVNTTK